jgi:hypothetical protein
MVQRTATTYRSKNRKYQGVKVLVSKEDFVPWFMERDFPGCSVDRIDKTGHYELSNMQVITLKENIRKDLGKAKDGRCVCYSCKKEKELSEFVKESRRQNGYSTICKACERKRTRNRGARK